MAQPDGSYPRLNGALLQSGQHQDKIVSLIGSLESSGSAIRLCDGAQVNLDLSQWPTEEPITTLLDTKVEVIGLVSSPHHVVVFVVRRLSKELDLTVYDRMLKIQHNPKFAQYFAPVIA